MTCTPADSYRSALSEVAFEAIHAILTVAIKSLDATEFEEQRRLIDGKLVVLHQLRTAIDTL